MTEVYKIKEYKDKYATLRASEQAGKLILYLHDVVGLLGLINLTEKEIRQMSKLNILLHGSPTRGGKDLYTLTGVQRSVVATWDRNRGGGHKDFQQISRGMSSLMINHGKVFFEIEMGHVVIDAIDAKYGAGDK